MRELAVFFFLSEYLKYEYQMALLVLRSRVYAHHRIAIGQWLDGQQGIARQRRGGRTGKRKSVCLRQFRADGRSDNLDATLSRTYIFNQRKTPASKNAKLEKVPQTQSLKDNALTESQLRKSTTWRQSRWMPWGVLQVALQVRHQRGERRSNERQFRKDLEDTTSIEVLPWKGKISRQAGVHFFLYSTHKLNPHKNKPIIITYTQRL